MDGARRQDRDGLGTATLPSDAAPGLTDDAGHADGTSREGSAGDMRRVAGPRIRLGPGPRRVTGNDLVLVRALVTGNNQTIHDLSALRAAEQSAAARRSRGRHGRRFVTEGFVDRLNRQLGEWLHGCVTAGTGWMTRRPDGPGAKRATATSEAKWGHAGRAYSGSFDDRRQAA
jgi:hypothetical protein